MKKTLLMGILIIGIPLIYADDKPNEDVQAKLRDYMANQKNEIAQRKAANLPYIECTSVDAASGCLQGYIAKTCVAPKAGRCDVVIDHKGDTAVCNASDGAQCTAKIFLRLWDKGDFEDQFKQAKN